MEKSIGEPNRAEVRHYLGVDYGSSKIGLAKAESQTRIAFVYKTIANDKNFFQNLLEIIARESIDTVVIGIPSHTNRKETHYPGERLGEELKSSLSYLKIEYQNEMFTTKMAQANLISRGVKGVKKHDDEEAARIILQEWLDLPRTEEA